MVSILPTPLQNCCLHSTRRQCYLLDVPAWHYTHDVWCVDVVCTCSCLGNQDTHVRGRLVRSGTWQRRNSVYKFHQPWKTLDTTHLLASFLACCCKIIQWLALFSKMQFNNWTKSHVFTVVLDLTVLNHSSVNLINTSLELPKTIKLNAKVFSSWELM